MVAPVWIGVDAKGPVSDREMADMRAALTAKWDEKGGGEYLETIETVKTILFGEEVEVTRIDWRTA